METVFNNVIINIMVSIFVLIYGVESFTNLALMSKYNYKGEISCNSEIYTSTTQESDNGAHYKFDLWKLNMDKSSCINIYITNDTNHYNFYNLFDCNGVLVDPSNDYLSSNKCKFNYFLELKHNQNAAYKLQIFCSSKDGTQCDKAMRRVKSVETVVKIGYLRQFITLSNTGDEFHQIENRRLQSSVDSISGESVSSESVSSDDGVTISTAMPTGNPTAMPTGNPTAAMPTVNPTDMPTVNPTAMPITGNPTDMPTGNPTDMPTGNPTDMPTGNPTDMPTGNPTTMPTVNPTDMPTTAMPTGNPTVMPTGNPTTIPTPEECTCVDAS
eukprot:467793_1